MDGVQGVVRDAELDAELDVVQDKKQDEEQDVELDVVPVLSPYGEHGEKNCRSVGLGLGFPSVFSFLSQKLVSYPRPSRPDESNHLHLQGGNLSALNVQIGKARPHGLVRASRTASHRLVTVGELAMVVEGRWVSHGWEAQGLVFVVCHCGGGDYVVVVMDRRLERLSNDG
jgi:hypothetical protein